MVINFVSNHSAAAETAAQCQKQAAEKGHIIKAIIIKADVGKSRERQSLCEETRRHLGRIDLLINNAGMTSIGRTDLLEAKEENYDRLMEVNLKGPFFLTQTIANWMIEQKKAHPDRKPKIINIGSISAYTASIHRADYCLSKAALEMMTKLYAARLAKHGIAVHEVRPGIISSDMTFPVKQKYDRLIEEGLTPIQRWGMPEDVGLAVATIAKDRFPFSTGCAFDVDGGFHIRQL